MRILGSKKRFAVVASTTAALLIGGGVAVAYWTTSGSGTGSASVGTDTAVTITQTNTVTGLYPGGPDKPIDLSVNNSSSSAETISSITISVSGTSAAGCTAADFAVTQPTGVAGPVAPGATAFPSSSTGAAVHMINSASNQDACKNATVNFEFSAA